MPPSRAPDATFLLPCLNEAASLPGLLAHAKEVLGRDGAAWKILVADNGSTDGSRELARGLGAEVVEVPRKGYGAALHAGILAAGTEWVVYADADGTYRPEDAVRLLAEARAGGADLVLGSRLEGKIHPGAMPWSHRYLGTPVLSFLLRLLYGVPVTDCNSGIRCVRAASYRAWRVRSRGMEFASALLIRAAASGARISETPVELLPSKGKRVPHLRTWTDGMRHLLVILAGSPSFFWHLACLLLPLSLALAVPCLWGPRIVLGRFGFWGEHTLVVATLLGFYGALSADLALLLHSRGAYRHVPAPLAALLRISEGALFWGLVATLAVSLGGCAYVALQWSHRGYRDIDFVALILFFLYLTITHTTLLFGLFQAQLNRRTEA